MIDSAPATMPDDPAPTGPRRSTLTVLSLAAVLLVAALFRLSRIHLEELWYDEMWAASFSTLNWFDITMATLRFDIHPPAWMYQLQLWSIVDNSDPWLMLNSILWSVAAVASVFAIADRQYGRRVAWIAAALLAVMPVAVDMARQVRPYAFLTVIVPWAWYLSDSALTREPRKWRLPTMGLLVLLAVYSHGSGVLLACYVGIAGLARMVSASPPTERIKKWLAVQSILAVMSIPALIQSVVRQDAAHLEAPTLEDVRHVLAYLFFGSVWKNQPLAGALACMAVLGVMLSALCFRKGRLLIACFVVTPFLLTALISHLIKPMWFIRGFWFMAPFLCLAVATSLENLASALTRNSRAAARLSSAIAGLLLVVGVIGSAREVTEHPKPAAYARLMEAIDADLQPGDVIYVPQQFDLWGIARYFVGPDWGSALEVQDLDPELAAPHKWGAVLRWLGPAWRARLHLEPLTCRIENERANLYVGFGSAERVVAEKPPHVFLVIREDNIRPLPNLAGYSEVGEKERLIRSEYAPGFVLSVWERNLPAEQATPDAPEITPPQKSLARQRSARPDVHGLAHPGSPRP